MKMEQNQINEFMVKAGQGAPDRPTLPPLEVRKGRLKWLAEELCELANAWSIEFDLNNSHNTTGNIVLWPASKPQFSNDTEAITEAYDATIDMLVFAIGNGVAMGTDLQPGWDEVHTSNMAKFGPGGSIREDGKVMKPPGWKKPDLASIIAIQLICAKQRDKQQVLV